MSSRHVRILLIEDDAGDAGRIGESLLDEGGDQFSVEHVDRLGAGLRRLGHGDVAAVLLDLRLPDSDGIETLHRVRQTAPHVPIVVLSGPGDESLALQAMHEGAQDYLVKGEVQGHHVVRALRHAFDRERTAEALRISEERYRLLFANNLAGILVSTEEGKILDCNEAFARMLGYDSPEEIRAPAVDYYCHHEDRAALVAQLRVRGSVFNREICLKRKDGGKIWVLVNVNLLTAQSGPRIIQGTIIDITERRQAREALEVSEASYASLVESIPLHVFRKDRAGRFIFANRRFCQALGRPAEAILGKKDADFYPAELAAKYHADDERVLATGEVFEDTEINARAGKRTYVKIVKTPVYGAGLEIVGTQGIFWDVTVENWAEEQRNRMGIARAIQKKLFPLAPPQVAGFDIGGATFLAEATGGDYYDYLPLRDGSVGLVLGDVSGHGFGPALFAAVTHACLRTLAWTQPELDPGAFLATANRLVYEDTGGDPFVTLFFARLDPGARSMVYASAGHPPCYLLDPAGENFLQLGSTGPALGIFAEVDIHAGPTLTLPPGALVLLVSDGLQDAMRPDGQFFGADRVLEVVRSQRHRPAQDIVAALCQVARDFCQGAPPHDDITAVVIKAK